MILEIDYGNTRLKWRLLAEGFLGCVVDGGVVDHISELSLVLVGLGCESLKFCRVCSVRNAEANARLVQVIEAHHDIPVVFARSVRQHNGVRNGYLEPGLLGVDRWLAILAAHMLVGKNCIVIDCGTAITADLVAVDGVHLGGCIAPGVKMLNTVLLDGTQIYLEPNGCEQGEGAVIGRSTSAAIHAGTSSMMAGFLREQLMLAEKFFGSGFVVVGTGGDSRLIRAVAPSVLIQDDLVFTGLALACPYHIKE